MATGKATTKKGKTSSNPNGLETLLTNLSGMLEQNTRVLKQIAGQIGTRIVKGRKNSIVENDTRNVIHKPQREVFNADNVFLETLKKIGSASTTREVAMRLTRDNKEMQKMYRKNKDQFMQFLYTSASNLAKEGKIKRAPAGKRRFAYSLKGWNSKK